MEIQSITYPRTNDQQRMILPFDTNGIVSLFDSHKEAESAIIQLQHLGFNMRNLSIVGRDFQTEENVVGFYNFGNRTKYWGKQGVFWGAICGMLVGSAMIIIPGFAPLVVAGTFVTTIVTAVEGALLFGSISVLGAALYSIGIPHNSIVDYETAMKKGKFMMILHGTLDDLSRARLAITHVGGKNTLDFDITEEDADEESQSRKRYDF